MKIKIMNKSKHNLPEYATLGSSGVDLMANIESDITIKPFERVLVKTGLFIEMPNNIEAQIRARSGLAIRHGITTLNGIGTIDSDYRGEIGVILINLGQEEFTITDGMRIAQMVFAQFERVEFQEVSELSDSVRNSGGFGHTGV